MNPIRHCCISRGRWGGQEKDYYPIHEFIDSTKELCSDCRHRILHTHWGINQIVIPIFGQTLINSDGKAVDVKDMCERDHLLADYDNQFIPTLSELKNSFDGKTARLMPRDRAASGSSAMLFKKNGQEENIHRARSGPNGLYSSRHLCVC
ncbi:MAG: hypothetical protein GVY17_02810 [Cyanobacteria bacterium]|jgi:hypothetical protein|nr:hypothetical protein [Cyanobacteria bacterium GSL.Bin21]